MRITVNLSLFFHDHRCLAKIFINKKMKCIRNIQEHLSTIFKIENFYLKCENEYLPPTEDVQILNNDDIVWAIPTKDEYDAFRVNNVLPQNEEVMEEANVVSPKKKKKKNKHLTNTKEENLFSENKSKKAKRQQSSDTELEVEIIQKKKKKKKKNHADIDDSKDVSFTNIEQKEEHQDVEEINSNPGKTKQNFGNSSLTELIQKDSGRDSLNSSKSGETPESKSSVKCLVNEFEKKKTKFSKELNESFNEPERKINIVKTIIISNKKTASSSLPNANQPEAYKEHSTFNNVSHNVNTLDNNHEYQAKHKNDEYQPKDKTDEHQTKDKNSEHQGSEISSDAETSSVYLSSLPERDTNVNKRRRRRTRRKRSGIQKTSEITSTYEQPVYNFIHKSLIVQTQTPTHLRFTDNQLRVKEEDVLPLTESVVDKDVLSPEIVVDKVPIKDSSDTVVIVKESPHRESVDASDVINENTEEKAGSVHSDKELEECVLKQPVIQNSEPRVGDVIAFKILIISENNTPEVSKPIVGKVIDYKNENKEVTFDIVYGHKQCLPPKGKFSLDQEDYQENETSHFKCLWSTLFEPRLVYP